ncbi:MAG: Inorganic pyrophosphatase [Candidatus Woesearchaeota archaeon]|nr:Inorganic pyrophosphatase [Candidatus Woesearchaeota archaeon]
MNAWHDISPGKVPDKFNVLVETPKGSKNKYELDKKTGLLKLDRTLYSPVYYPGDYGFIPQTWWYDNDPLDVVVISSHPVYPLTLVIARPIGLIKMIDNEQKDFKIMAVPIGDPNFKDIKKLSDLPEHKIKEIEHFFNIYKELQEIKCEVVKFKGRKSAKKIINTSIQLYKEKFKK